MFIGFTRLWAKHYSDPETYFVTTSIIDPSTFHFPGMGPAGANVLVERQIAGLSASIELEYFCPFFQSINISSAVAMILLRRICKLESFDTLLKLHTFFILDI